MLVFMKLTPQIIKLVTAGLFLLVFSCLFYSIHYGRFADDGVGVPSLSGLGLGMYDRSSLTNYQYSP
jgi:hypothetical protein